MLIKALQVAYFILIPILMLWLEPRFKIVRKLSPLIFCYLFGILMGNQHLVAMDTTLSLKVCQASIALAIPLLLFSLDLIAWLRVARTTIISFLLIVGSVVAMSFLANSIFSGIVEESPKVASMLVGVYTGGTPNLAAIGTALRVKSETLLMVNAADMLLGAIYLPFLFAIEGKLLSKVLPPFPKRSAEDVKEAQQKSAEKLSLKLVVFSLLLAIAFVILASVASQLFSENLRESIVILIITTLAITSSFSPKVRALPKTMEIGQFLLLIFCVAIGTTADFNKFFSSSTHTILLYTATVLYGSMMLHRLLCIFLRLDRDTVMITSTAAIFSPPFVGPVAVALKNREVVFSGIATGLVGYAIGNYMGISLAWILS